MKGPVLDLRLVARVCMECSPFPGQLVLELP